MVFDHPIIDVTLGLVFFIVILSLLRGSVLVSHTAFARVAFERAMHKYDLEQLQVSWLDSSRVVRKAWPEKYAHRGYGLSNVALDLGITFNHHDALEDAATAAKIAIHACADTGTGISHWLEAPRHPIRRSHSWPATEVGQYLNRSGNPDGSLYGETVLFTGALRMPRRQAADMAARAGCNVALGVSKKNAILVVGVQNRQLLMGYAKSNKHRAVEA